MKIMRIALPLISLACLNNVANSVKIDAEPDVVLDCNAFEPNDVLNCNAFPDDEDLEELQPNQFRG